VSDEEATFSIRDEGPGFDVDALPDPTDKDHLENRAGRGILLMKSFMDKVSYTTSAMSLS
jgi:anti-sigma regulatory factor (Ser/Thr protein kinase)